MTRVLVVMAFVFCAIGKAQNPGPAFAMTTVPSGACTSNRLDIVGPGGTLYTCQNGTWAQASGGGGSGSGISYCAPASASSTTYTCTPSPALAAYVAGASLGFTPDVTASAGAVTVNVNGLGAKSITEADGITNPTATDLIAGSTYILVYDGTRFRITPPPIPAGNLYQAPDGSVGALTGFVLAAPTNPTYNAGGTTTVDWSVTNNTIVTASGGNTTLAFTAPSPHGSQLTELTLCNDSSVRTFTFPGTVLYGVTPAVINKCTYQQFFWNGTSYIGQPAGSDETGIIRCPETAAPGTPASATGVIWCDSTNHVLSYKANGSTTVSNTVVPDTGAANNFVTAVSALGVISKAQPAFSNLSGTATTAQLPGSGATTVNGQTCTLGSTCTVSGGGSSGWTGTAVTLVTTVAQYAPFVGGGTTSGAGTEVSVSVPAPASGTIGNLKVSINAAVGGSATFTVTLRDGSASQALTCTTASGGTTCSDTTHTVSVAQGDILDWLVVGTGTITAATPQISIAYTYGISATCATCTVTIASGTSALGTSSISTATCATVVTTSATGVAATDAIIWTPNASIKAVTGYVPATTGGLTIAAYPTANNVNFDVCNWSGLSITPGAVTLNWRVAR